MATFNNSRTKTTRFLLKKALFEYLSEKTIMNITVKMVCDRAEINRSTFYLHYDSIQSLMQAITDEELQQFIIYTSSTNSNSSLREVFIKYFEYIKENDNIFSVLLNGNYPDFEKSFISCIYDITIPIIINKNNHYSNLFSIAGCLQVTKNWILEGYKESCEEITDILLSIVEKLL